MIVVGNNEYRLILLDTNIIRTIVNGFDPNHPDHGIAKKILNYYGENFMLCVSAYSLLEINPFQDINDTFIGIFTVLPILIFLDFRTIFKEEELAYQENREFLTGNVAYYCKPSTNDVLIFIQKQFSPEKIREELEESCNYWNEMKLHVPKNPSVKNEYLQKIKLTPRHLYSYLIMEYSCISRLCNKKPMILNDVVDIKISAIAPYVDVVITENSQAHIYKEASKLISKLKDVRILTLGELRKQMDKEDKIK